MTTTITSVVAERLAQISPQVNERVIEHLVNVELEKRSNAIVSGLENLRGLQNDLKKIKPDQVSVDENGNEVSATYSKSKFEERKKLLEQIAKVEKALDLAIDKGDMSKLYELKK